MNQEEIDGVVITLGLLLDQIQAGADAEIHRTTIAGLGDLLAAHGGLGLMGKVLDQVLDQDPEKDSWREGVLDACWSGIGGWGS